MSLSIARSQESIIYLVFSFIEWRYHWALNWWLVPLTMDLVPPIGIRNDSSAWGNGLPVDQPNLNIIKNNVRQPIRSNHVHKWCNFDVRQVDLQQKIARNRQVFSKYSSFLIYRFRMNCWTRSFVQLKNNWTAKSHMFKQRLWSWRKDWMLMLLELEKLHDC